MIQISEMKNKVGHKSWDNNLLTISMKINQNTKWPSLKGFKFSAAGREVIFFNSRFLLLLNVQTADGTATSGACSHGGYFQGSK
jgi:hypothetical protein